MRASKFSDSQKAFILKQGDEGVPVAEICRKAGISVSLRRGPPCGDWCFRCRLSLSPRRDRLAQPAPHLAATGGGVISGRGVDFSPSL